MRALLMSSGVAAMVMAAAAVAQAAPATRQEVKIPFTFVINGQELPAGTYSVQQNDANDSALLIQGEGKSVYLLTAPVSRTAAPQDTSLVFAKDGAHYRLAEIWDADGDGLKIVDAGK
jgi:hypothetical protein